MDVLRKGAALLSVLLVLTAFRCMATCIVSDAGTSAHNNSSTVPPCHRHHAPARDSVPCRNHPGLAAYTVDQPSAQVDLHVNLLAAVYEPAPSLRAASGFGVSSIAHTPPLPRSEALSSIVLRI